MKKNWWKSILVFILGMLVFAVGSFFVRTFILVQRPERSGIIEDFQQICFWPDVGGMYASVSPRGCFPSYCTHPKLRAGSAIVDVREYKIQFETQFVLEATSRFPFPCVDNCAGGGTVSFNLGPLIPYDYEVWFRDEKIGQLQVYSGRETPRQCIERPAGDV
ncbi:MAG: hypothetical protein JSV69_15580 [Chloroflexota bacterium]|nr:MAG: hypothetical protein JSV69_15580 [Chloroflexota bacterium]